jgi:hypothetical protein
VKGAKSNAKTNDTAVLITCERGLLHLWTTFTRAR